MAFTKVVGAGIHTLSNIASHNINSSGIITATKFVGPMENGSGISTFYDLRVTNNLTVDGSTTTLDTDLIGVDRVEVAANSNSIVGVAITQSGTADILRLYDGTSQVVTVDDEGKVGLGSAIPAEKLDVAGNIKFGTVQGTNTNAALNVLFQTATGVIDGGSQLTYNPSQDLLSVNGLGLTVNQILGGGNTLVLAAANYSSTSQISITNKVNILVEDNGTDAFTVKQGSNEYITVDTNNSSELITLGNTTTNPKTIILGVLGVRTTPAVWHTDRRVIQLGGASLSGQNPADGQELSLTNNAFYDSADNRWEFIADDDANGIFMSNGGIFFKRSPASGTAGNVLNWATSLQINDTGYVQTKSEFWVGGSSPVLRWRDTTHGEKATARIDGSDLYFEVNNSEKLRIKSGTNPVEIKNFSGIGLHMSGGADPTIRVQDTDGTNQYGDFAHNAGDTYIVTRNNTSHGEFVLYSNNGSETKARLKVDSSGDVSIGHGTPTFSDVNSVSGGNVLGIEIFRDGTDTASALKLAGDNGSGNKAHSQLGYSGANATAHWGNYNTSGTLQGQIVIGATGGVGINETSPQSILDVRSDIGSHPLGAIFRKDYGGDTTDSSHKVALTVWGQDHNDLDHTTGTDFYGPMIGFGARTDDIAPNTGDVRAAISYVYNGQLTFHTEAGGSVTDGSNERLRIDGSGKFFFHGTGATGANNTSALLPAGYTLNVHGTNSNDGISVVRYSGSYGAYGLNIGRSRNDTFGTNTAVQDGDELGHVTFYGADGTNFDYAAQITGLCDGAVGTGGDATDMPGALSFRTTPEGSASPTEALRIDSSGHLVTGGATPPNQAANDGSIFLKNDATLGFLSQGGSLTFNAYYNGGWKYVTNAAAHIMWGSSDGINFSLASSGTADNTISFSRAMKIHTNNRISIGDGNSTTPLAALHINTKATMGTDTALWIGDNANNRYMTINQVSNSEQFSHMELRFNDNGRRNLLYLSNPYGPAGYGTGILWRGYNNNTQAYIETASEGADNANSTMKIYSSGNSGIDITHNSGVYIREPTLLRGVHITGHSSAQNSYESAYIQATSTGTYANIDIAPRGTRGQINFGGHGSQSIYLLVEGGSIDGNQTLTFDYTWHPGGAGGLKISAWASHWTSQYNLIRDAYVFGDSYAGMTEEVIKSKTSTEQGAWTFSRPSNSKFRIEKSAGTYNGGMNYCIMIWHPGNSMTLRRDT